MRHTRQRMLLMLAIMADARYAVKTQQGGAGDGGA